MTYQIHYQRMQKSNYPHVFVLSHGRTYTTESVTYANQIQSWCEDQFGRPGDRWNTTLIYFWLRDDDDAFAFKMRWL